MNLLDFARGPALDVAIAIFLFGVAWRLLSLWLLPHAVDRSVARADAPSGFSARVPGGRPTSSRPGGRPTAGTGKIPTAFRNTTSIK